MTSPFKLHILSLFQTVPESRAKITPQPHIQSHTRVLSGQSNTVPSPLSASIMALPHPMTPPQPLSVTRAGITRLNAMWSKHGIWNSCFDLASRGTRNTTPKDASRQRRKKKCCHRSQSHTRSKQESEINAGSSATVCSFFRRSLLCPSISILAKARGQMQELARAGVMYKSIPSKENHRSE